MTQQAPIDTKHQLPLVNNESTLEAELQQFEALERQRLGIADDKTWVEDMANLGFSKSEKSKVTLLIGGLTMAHDYLVEGALKNLGYDVLAMDCPDYDALRVGKEFGNRAQCNPTYFTVGNLVKFLIELRDEKGMSTKEIIDKFVFLTAGACGPCRFGMYVTEYRKALRDAGFEGFRVMLFQQQGGLSQASGEESGLELNPAFFISLLKALVAGDVLNALGYRLRPYEVEAGATDEALSRCKKICYDALQNGKSLLWALHQSKQELKKVAVDRTRTKPKVAIIGEFWAMTTEGDGNYQLQRFLESEGAEADIQLVTAWILYNIWEVAWDTENRVTLRGEDAGKNGLKDIGEHGYLMRRVGLALGDRALRTVFQVFAHAGGLYGYHLPNMFDVAEIAAPHYNNDLRGGEGHMEVGKLILNVVKSKATMTLSVKPFGCMPSSGVSDGVQSLITEKYPGSIYCAVETSGDGAVNFYSRVQMYLFKAKQAAQREVDMALEKYDISIDQVRDYLAQHPRLARSLYHPPHSAACTPADMVHVVGERLQTPAWQRHGKQLTTWFKTSGKVALRLARSTPNAARISATASAELFELVREKGPDAGRILARRFGAQAARVIPIGERNSTPAN